MTTTNLGRWMAATGTTASQLAAKSGVSEASVRRWMDGGAIPTATRPRVLEAFATRRRELLQAVRQTPERVLFDNLDLTLTEQRWQTWQRRARRTRREGCSQGTASSS